MEFFLSAIQHARISSLVGRKLYSTRTAAVPVVEVVKMINELDGQIRDWWARLPAIFRSRPTSRVFRDHPNIDMIHWTYIYFAFHGTLCAIHNVITYPWAQPQLNLMRQQDTMTQVERSSVIVAEASRAIASMTQQSETTAASQVWYVLIRNSLPQRHLKVFDAKILLQADILFPYP